MSAQLLAKNRRALYDHVVLSQYVAGIVLKGYEVKALREGKANFEGSYVQVLSGNPFIVNLYIAPYSKQSAEINTTDSRRSRGLLLKKKEVLDIKKELDQKGRTAVPLALVLDHNLVKLEFAVVKGKKEFEKKQVAKERQIARDMQQDYKDIRRSED